jgi:UDP-GlcNAc:undecaprenyl-phosphate GlcNAc-1-phosphate transferase
MSAYVLLVLMGASLSALLTPLVSRMSAAFGLVDAPGGRKVHLRSVSRFGGVAVCLSALGALWLLKHFRPELWPDAFVPSSVPILAGAGLVFAIGLLDDIRPVTPAAKLIVEAAAAVLVMSTGLLIERVTLLGTAWSLGWLAWPITFGWIVGLTNAFNLIDGIDGLASGVAVIACGTCAAILVARSHPAEATVLAAMAGGALGFLLFNFPPASIFLGDSGSLLFGFVLASTAVAGWQKGATALATGVPLLTFALPIADAATTLVRRIVAPRNGSRVSLRRAVSQIITPDRGHIHHRLLGLGWSTRRTVLILYAITGALSLLALATARVDGP